MNRKCTDILREYYIRLTKALKKRETMAEVKKRKLNYIFYNPNTPEETEKELLKVLVDANRKKVELAMREWAEKQKEEESG